MEYPNTSVDYPLYPENVIYTSQTKCCTKPPNPWTQSPSVGPQGCQCNSTCVNAFGPNPVRYRSESPDKRYIQTNVTDILDSRAAKYAGSMRSTNAAQNTSLISPSSYVASLAAIPTQRLASIINATNKAAAIAPQALAVAAASTATLCVSASRLALRVATDANTAYNSIVMNADDLAVLIHTVKLDVDALLTGSTNANNAASALFNNANSSLTDALETVSSTQAAASQARLDATTALCNCVKGSGAYNLQLRTNNINVTTAENVAERASILADSLLKSVNTIQVVSESTANALIDVNTAYVSIQQVDTLYQNALAAKATYNAALIGYHDTSGNFNTVPKRIAATAALAAMNAAYALLSPSSQLSDVLAKATAASASANLASSNARTLSNVLGASAKAAAAPSLNIVTPQNLATQTAAAERFGAAAAAAASRAARLSAALPIPPPTPLPEQPKYRARMPPQF